jgi:hypothetical protein
VFKFLLLAFSFFLSFTLSISNTQYPHSLSLPLSTY